jgi:hypothetical protein
MCNVIVQYEAVTNTIGLILERNSKDMNELSTDYLEKVFSICLQELKRASPVDFKSVTLNNVGLSFNYIRAAGAWKLLSSLMKMDLKWVSLHVKSLMYAWWDYFENSSFGCNLTSSSAEIHIYCSAVINSLETLRNFTSHCPSLLNTEIGTYISDLVMKYFKQICLDKKIKEKIPELQYLYLTRLIISLILNFDEQFFAKIKKILSQLNIMCFSDIVTNLSYLGKVPNFLLDKEERRIIRISFAELESYMILIPDSLEKPNLADDNIEHLPFTNTSN